jgi:hypothetical protein
MLTAATLALPPRTNILRPTKKDPKDTPNRVFNKLAWHQIYGMEGVLLYDSNCDIKEIVMDERIKLLEAVNRTSQNWKTVVDKRIIDGMDFEVYSEADVFSLQFRSMYLAIALKQLLRA